jgi:hypothetical protein
VEKPTAIIIPSIKSPWKGEACIPLFLVNKWKHNKLLPRAAKEDY